MVVAAAFMAVVEGVSTVEAVVASAAAVVSAAVVAVVSARVEEGGSVVARLRHLLLVIEVHVLHPHTLRGTEVVGTDREPAMALLDQEVISRAGIRGLAIPPRRLAPLTGSGILSATQREAVGLRAHNRELEPAPRLTREVFTSLAGIAERVLPARYAVFRGRVTMSMRMLPPREMSFPGLNRYPPFTIRSTDRPLRTPGFDRTPRSLPLRVLAAERGSRAIEDFRVA